MFRAYRYINNARGMKFRHFAVTKQMVLKLFESTSQLSSPRSFLWYAPNSSSSSESIAGFIVGYWRYLKSGLFNCEL